MGRMHPAPLRWTSWLKLGLLVVMLMGLRAAPMAAATASATEQQVKAAFLFKFGGYVEWPAQAFAGPETPLGIGVMGADGVADELSRMVQNRVVQGRAVVVRKLSGSDNLEGVHILFIAGRQRERLASIEAAARQRSILVVTEGAPAPPEAMVTFVVIDDKLRFDIALLPAEDAQLKISARLLSVARKVIGRPS